MTVQLRSLCLLRENAEAPAATSAPPADAPVAPVAEETKEEKVRKCLIVFQCVFIFSEEGRKEGGEKGR